MDRINDPTAEADKHGAGKDGFTEGDGGLILPTRVRSPWLDGVQEEVVGAIEASGQAPNDGSLYQLSAALRIMGIHAGLNQAGVLVDDSVDGVFASELVNAGCLSPGSAQRVFFCGDARRLGVSAAPYTEMSLVSLTGAVKDYEALCAYGVDNAVIVVGQDEEIISATNAARTTRNTGGTEVLRGVAWSPDLAQVCAVGDNGKIKIAATGALSTWTDQTPDASYSGDFNCVLWDSINAQWVIGGDTGEIQTSPDGINWTRRHTGGSAVSKIVVCTTRLVATGYTSTDGHTWTADGAVVAGFYSDGCLFGFDGESLNISGDEGETWNTRNLAGPQNNLQIVTTHTAFAVVNVGGSGTIRRLGSVNSFGG